MRYNTVTGVMDLLIKQHVEHIVGLEARATASTELYFTDHKRLSGVYWAMTSLFLLDSFNSIPASTIIKFTLSCYHKDKGAFGGNSDQDVHLLYTASGIQILALYDALDQIDGDKVAKYVASLQQPSGAFAGDEWGEIDSRFSYCALLILRILDRLDSVNTERAINFLKSCVNFDGGFGCIPGAESHAGQVFCGVGALAIAERLEEIDIDQLGWWLCERQLPCGGFNGRPDKLEDVCYSWWVLSSLSMIGRVDWIDSALLQKFILKCQDEHEGGIADRPGDLPDIFHTFFGLAGLSLLGHEQIKKIDPVLALPCEVVDRLNHRREKSRKTETENSQHMRETCS